MQYDIAPVKVYAQCLLYYIFIYTDIYKHFCEREGSARLNEKLLVSS